MAAQPYLLEGKLFGPREALELGLGRRPRATAPTSCAPQALAWIATHPRRDPAVGPRGLPDAGRHAGEPEDRRRARGRAGDARAEDARALSGAPQAILETMVEGALGRLRHRDRASRAGSSPRSWSSQTAKNMIQAFFFDLNAIKSGKSRPRGLPRVEAGEGRRARRRHDGRGHRPRATRRAASPCVLKDVSAAKAEAGLGGDPQDHRGAGRQGQASTELREAKLLGARSRPPPTPRALDGCDLDHRGGVREPRAEGRGDARGRADARRRRRLREQHLDAADQRPGRRRARGPSASSACTSSRRCTR